ncbi:MAG: outer membrane protein transport protein [Nitrospira sp.]|nr:outer membrane protein transport protein [Nitrospira sp.]MDH4242633.1 outer membrane protein transport protein [Nitrospira sp.]MDH4355208.1 outer membrane protein transport protein [Nitrospira sp.]
MIHRIISEFLPHTRCGVTQDTAVAYRTIALAFLLVLVGIGAAYPALAQVPRVYGQGAAASGMGNAFAAQADNPSALHYNPAGMTQLRGVQTMAGGTFVGGTSDFRSPTGISVTGDHDGAFAWPGPGHGYITANLSDIGISSLEKLTIGVGITTPFGSVMRWPETSPFSRITTYTAFPLFDIKPTFAYQLFPNLSIGAGADIYTFAGFFGEGHAELQSVSPGGLAPAGSKLEFNGRGTAPGFNISALYTALQNTDGLPIANVAVVYRSQATLHLDGALLANGVKVQDATTTFVLPQVITGGVALWPIRDAAREWKLELNVDYVGWKSVRNLDIRLANGIVIPQPQDWRGTYAILAGTEYRWLKIDHLPGWEIAIRGGYTNQQAQVPDLNFNPGVPSADLHVISTGIGLICQGNGSFLGLIPCGSLGMGSVRTKLVGLDIFYQAFLYEPRSISGNTGLRATVNGLYSSTLHAGGFSIRASF